jgi:biopolymer transport protein ExbD
MGMSVGKGGRNGLGSANAEINTTPLVDVMLVLLIIFLITIPVVVTSIPVNLPKDVNQPRASKPENIVLSVNAGGDVFWNELRISKTEDLVERLKKEAVKDPQPEVHIRGDSATKFEAIGRAIYACQRVGIVKISFVIEPPGR